jgi:flavin-dependent dehydrogenase
MILFEGIPNGPFDCWNSNFPTDKLEKAKYLIRKYIPTESYAYEHAVLTDGNGTLTGSYTPTVRFPILLTSKHNKVFALGDAAILNDPIAGQGANTAAKSAQIYLESIIENGKKPFNQDWMEKTFEDCWNSAKWSVMLSNKLLFPPEPHLIDLFKAAQRIPKLANLLADGFDNPEILFPWINEALLTHKLIFSYESRYFQNKKIPALS